MIIIGFVLFAAAVVIAAALIVQNPATVTVHAFNQAWNVDMRWLFVAGLALTAIGLIGLGMMRLGSAHYMRLRGERRVLAAENRRLTRRATAPAPTSAAPDAAPDTGPRTAPAAQDGGAVAPTSSSDRPGLRERLGAARHRTVRS